MQPILVAGTGSWEDDGRIDWYCPGHAFGKFLTEQGVAPSYDGSGQERPSRPFVWSTGLAGVPFFTSKKTWAAGGAALKYFAVSQLRLGGRQTSLIAHSHGLQVALFACAEQDLKVDVLISVGSPVREDMMPVAERAMRNIGYWLHLYSDGSDRWQWFGELFDGHLGIVRKHPLADQNDSVSKVGHSKLLRDPAQYHYWVERGWLDLLKG